MSAHTKGMLHLAVMGEVVMFDDHQIPRTVCMPRLKADAARLVACWNKLEPHADLDKVAVVDAAELARLQAEDHPGPHEKARILAELTVQRDALAVALCSIQQQARGCTGFAIYFGGSSENVGREMLADEAGAALSKISK